MSEPCIDIFFLMGYNTSLYVIFLFSDDHTLVQLRPLPGSRRPEYINASFIDGFQKSRAYIATQVILVTSPTQTRVDLTFVSFIKER